MSFIIKSGIVYFGLVCGKKTSNQEIKTIESFKVFTNKKFKNSKKNIEEYR